MLSENRLQRCELMSLASALVLVLLPALRVLVQQIYALPELAAMRVRLDLKHHKMRSASRALRHCLSSISEGCMEKAVS